MDARSHICPTGGDKYASEGQGEREIGRFAGRQLQLVTTSQMQRAGLSRNAISNRARRGRLHRMYHGVYATQPPPWSREQRWLGAVLSCGAGSMLSDWPASFHWQMATAVPDLSAHVTVVGGCRRNRPGITVHQRGPIDPRDYSVKDGIPITAPHLDAGAPRPAGKRDRAGGDGDAAESLGLLKRGRLAELVAERRGRPGVHKLAPLLGLEPRITRSDLELLFIPVVDIARLPRPLINHPVQVPGREWPLVVDLCWPDIRFVVELDSQRFHGDWERAEIDRDRDQLLALAGSSSQRFVRRVVTEDPAGSAERLRLLHAARCREVGAPVHLPVL